MNPQVTIKQGVLHIDGQPTFVWSADYPYYRDQRADWSRQLDNLKKMNVEIVTFYVSWRHHAPVDPLHGGGKYDFRGELNDRTDVLEFIRLIREKGMYCVVKPGPYIHAETRFGSLPDYVLPDNNQKIPVRTDMHGHATPACWGFARPPAPMDPEYLPYVKDWFRVVAHNPEAYLKYKVVGKVARGINMEENWGFDSYDPPNYLFVQPSYFQSLAYMLWGATGLNIYLGVSCDCWTDYLAVDAGGVYMHNHPIGEDGSYRASFWTCHQLGALMKNIGSDLVSQPLYAPVAWGLYSPYAHAGGWDISAEDWKKAGFSDRPHAAPGWISFMALCEKNKTANGICYPREETVERLLAFRAIFMAGGDWMDAATQRKLVEYVERGGVLVMTSRVPDLDADFAPCAILRDALFPCKCTAAADEEWEFSYAFDGFQGTGCGPLMGLTDLGAGLEPALTATVRGQAVTCGALARRGRGQAILLGFSPWLTEHGEWGSAGLVEHIARTCAGVGLTAPVAVEPTDPLVEAAEFRCDARGRRHVFLLTRRDKPDDYTIALRDESDCAETFGIRLPAFSGAIVGFEKDRIVAAHIKGHNDLDKSDAAPRLSFGLRLLAAADACDLYFGQTEDGECELSVVNVQNERNTTIVTLPLAAGEIESVVQVTSGGREIPVTLRDVDGRVGFEAVDMRQLKAGAALAGGEWSPHYLIRMR